VSPHFFSSRARGVVVFARARVLKQEKWQTMQHSKLMQATMHLLHSNSQRYLLNETAFIYLLWQSFFEQVCLFDCDDCLYFNDWHTANHLTEKIEAYCIKYLDVSGFDPRIYIWKINIHLNIFNLITAAPTWWRIQAVQEIRHLLAWINWWRSWWVFKSNVTTKMNDIDSSITEPIIFNYLWVGAYFILKYIGSVNAVCV
jgi:hypothetical protein